jgi:hypothetical protein
VEHPKRNVETPKDNNAKERNSSELEGMDSYVS